MRLGNFRFVQQPIHRKSRKKGHSVLPPKEYLGETVQGTMRRHDSFGTAAREVSKLAHHKEQNTSLFFRLAFVALFCACTGMKNVKSALALLRR